MPERFRGELLTMARYTNPAFTFPSGSSYIAGTILNRHRVPKPAPDEDQFYRADDLNIGVELNLHSRVVKLVNCDDFTRNFLQKIGVRLNPPIQIPADPYSCERKAVSVTL